MDEQTEAKADASREERQAHGQADNDLSVAISQPMKFEGCQ